MSREYINPFEKLDNTSTPLLYRAAQNAVYGQRCEFESGSITDAMFVYLDGSSSPKSMEALDRNYRLRPLVCLTGAWEQFIKQNYPDAHVCNRYMMKPACQFLTDGEIALPDGFRVALFDEKAFSLHPFSHGENYSSFAAFQEYGAGAVVWHNDRIVASASSFITVNDEIELDVSTEEAYRGKGLASACISFMLQDCAKRGIIVHWDAQNEASLHLAEKFGFEQECAYCVYFLPECITDESIGCLTGQVFRKAWQGDREQVLSLYRSASRDALCVWNDDYPTAREIENDLETGNLYVLTDGGSIIGAISVVPENELDGFDCWSCREGREIARVVIHKAHRGRGLSFEMVQRVEAVLREKGHASIRLSVVKTNIPAYKTYLKAGFCVVGEAQMYGNDYYLMDKEISAVSSPRQTAGESGA